MLSFTIEEDILFPQALNSSVFPTLIFVRFWIRFAAGFLKYIVAEPFEWFGWMHFMSEAV